MNFTENRKMENTSEEKKIEQDTIEILETPQEEIQEKKEDYQEKFLRLAADMENLRRRVAKEKEESARFALQSFAKDILRVADHLYLALQSAQKDSGAIQSFISGIEMTEKELHSILEKYGIRKVKALGEKFDAHCHQAISEESESESESQTVTQVLQEGYFLHERLLRPSLVIVRK